MLKVLLTNDDGIQSAGIRQLALRLARHCEVSVVAPSTPSSATSHSITLHKPLRLLPARRHGYEVEGVGGKLQAFHCSGTPGDCVMLGVMHVHKGSKPDLVISGINDGINVAQDLTYSGTVGGALEGAVLGVPSLAVSLDRHKGGAGFDNAALLAEAVATLLLYGMAPEGLAGDLRHWNQPAAASADGLWRIPETGLAGELYPSPVQWWPAEHSQVPCLNVNLPDLEPRDIAGICWTSGGRREYIDVIQESRDPRGRPYYWIGGEKVLTDSDKPGCDLWALKRKLISVTPMTYDITSLRQLRSFREQAERSTVSKGQ